MKLELVCKKWGSDLKGDNEKTRRKEIAFERAAIGPFWISSRQIRKGEVRRILEGPERQGLIKCGSMVVALPGS